jgi:hypothetical protein
MGVGTHQAIEPQDVSLADFLNLQMAEGWIDVALEHCSIVVERNAIVIGIERSICEPYFGNLGEGWRLSQCSAQARRITTMIDIDPDLACFLTSFSECQDDPCGYAMGTQGQPLRAQPLSDISSVKLWRGRA